MEETIRLSVEPALRGEKGDPFTYEDFTPEQLEGLKPKKGIDYWTAEEVEEYITKPQQAEAARKTAEEARVSAETSRVSAESSRVSAENARVAAETTRNQAEQQRIAAENARTTTFAEWEQKESEMEQAEAERIAAEQLRIQAENHREEFIGLFEDKLENTANGVVLSASGTHIAIEGASGNNRLQSLTVYGKTTQDGTPTPDAPVEMVSVENPIVTVCRRNLAQNLRYDTVANAGVTYTYVGDGKYTLSGTATGTSVIFLNQNTANDETPKFILKKDSKYKIKDCQLYIINLDGTSNTIDAMDSISTITPEFDYRVVGIRALLKSGKTYDESRIYEPMIVESDVDVDYEPYEGKTVTLSDIVLRSTPDGTADRVFKDADGLWKVERNVNYIDDISIMEYGFNTRATAGVTFHFKVNDAIDVLNSDTLCRTICNKLGGSYGINIQNMEISMISNSRLYVNLAYSSLGEGYSYDSGVNVLSTAFKSWLEANSPISVQYAKNTPTYEVLPDTIQSELNALHSYYPYTTIMNNAGTQMDAEYVADTKTYVNSNPYVATESMIDSRENTRASIPLENLDYAVKAAMCDGKGAEWTDDEKVSARNRLGANYDAEIQRTKRSLDALWKLNNGISYQYETDDTTAYQKTVPSGAKLCGLSKIGGKTLVWNQLCDMDKCRQETQANVVFTYEDGWFIANGTPNNYFFAICGTVTKTIVQGHTYYARLTHDNVPQLGNSTLTLRFDNSIGQNIHNSENLSSYLFTAKEIGATIQYAYLQFKYVDTYPTFKNAKFKVEMFDLTRMFGAGNEPATVEEFEAMFPSGYYPYNAGELLSFPMNEMVEQGRNLFDIASILTDSASWSYTTVTLEPNTTYTVSSNIPQSSSIRLFAFASDKSADGNTNSVYDGRPDKVITNDDGIVKFQWRVTDSSLSFSDYNYQIELGETATPYSQYRHNLITTPQAILDLDGFGVGINDTVYNYVDKENKLYRKQSGVMDLGSLDWSIKTIDGQPCFETDINTSIACPVSAAEVLNAICTKYDAVTWIQNRIDDAYDFTIAGRNGIISIRDSGYTDAAAFKEAMSGVILLYELAEEEIIDISDILTDDEPFEVEAGGSLTFKNSNGDGYRVPIPTEEKYIISLAEVSGVTV